MKLYKYTTISSALDIIDSEGLWMKKPQEFNDIFDCNFKQNDEDKKRIVNLMKHFAVLSVMDSVSKTREIGKRPIISINKKEISIIKSALKRDPYFDGCPGFVALFNIMVKKNPAIQTEFNRIMTSYQKEIDEAVEKEKRRALICCFSERFDSPLMWSHYSDSHKGVCLEYEVPDDVNYHKVTYQKERPTVFLYKTISHFLAQAIIDDFRTDKLSIDDMSDLILPFTTKSIDWTYEKEIRYVCSENDYFKHNIILDSKGKFILILGKPSKVYIGCRAEQNNLHNDFIKKIDDLGIDFVKMKPSETTFDIIPEK